MCMKLPFSWGWINKASLSRADKKPARLPARRGVTRLLVANALLISKVHSGPKPFSLCLFLWPSACNRQYCESNDPALPGTVSSYASCTLEKKKCSVSSLTGHKKVGGSQWLAHQDPAYITEAVRKSPDRPLYQKRMSEQQVSPKVWGDCQRLANC